MASPDMKCVMLVRPRSRSPTPLPIAALAIDADGSPAPSANVEVIVRSEGRSEWKYECPIWFQIETVVGRWLDEVGGLDWDVVAYSATNDVLAEHVRLEDLGCCIEGRIVLECVCKDSGVDSNSS